MKTLRPVKKESVSPKRYLDLSPSEKSNIKSSHFVPPKIGDGSFGKFEVTYKNPVLKEVDLGR